MKATFLSIFAVLFTLLIAGCGGGGPADITITPVGEEMKYAVTEFTVQPGQTVNLTFNNTATSPAMSHNVVILRDNDDATVERVGQEGMTAGEANDYIPNDPAILAHTPLSHPGETVSVTFTAPTEPGTYRYICTFPGHYMMMQGTMTVAG